MQAWLCTVWKMYFNFVGESSPLRARFALLSGHPADHRSLSCLPYPILPICTGNIPQTLEPEYLPLMKFRYRSSFRKGKQSYLNLNSKVFLWNWYVFWSFKMGQFDIIVYSVNRLRVLLDMNIIVLGHSLLQVFYLQIHSPFREEQNDKNVPTCKRSLTTCWVGMVKRVFRGQGNEIIWLIQHSGARELAYIHWSISR